MVLNSHFSFLLPRSTGVLTVFLYPEFDVSLISLFTYFIEDELYKFLIIPKNDSVGI